MPPKTKENAEKLMQQLAAKTTITDRLILQSTEVLQCRQQRRVQRHKDQIEEKLTECIKLLSIIQELKITEGEDEESTMEWTTEREKKHHEWDNVIEDLDQHINQLRKDEDQQRKQEEIAIEEDRRSKPRTRGRPMD